MKLTTKIRSYMGLENSDRTTVDIIDGESFAPALVGERGYFTTPSGKTVVEHPGSYGYRTIYHRSTRRITVGSLWVASNII